MATWDSYYYIVHMREMKPGYKSRLSGSRRMRLWKVVFFSKLSRKYLILRKRHEPWTYLGGEIGRR